MHSKIIHPKKHGRFVFSNKSSSAKAVGYLGHEAKEEQRPAYFFSQEKENIEAQEVKSTIDQNAKGLRKEQEKFYSLVLSPSEEELKHIGHDHQKLQQYTRKVMENYAANFQLKHEHGSNRKLFSSDLLWYATIHEERKFKEGEQKGVAKAGLHQHVHIIVSGKDKSGEIRLNPRLNSSYFPIKDWQIENGKSFQQLFGYEKATTSEKLTAAMPEEKIQKYKERIRDRIAYLNQHFTGSEKIEINKVMSLAQEQQYGKGFFFRLHHLTQSFQQGKLVNDPYHVLEKGKDISFKEKLDRALPLPEKSMSGFAKSIQQLGSEAEQDDLDIGSRRKKKPSQQIER
jgi:hypothetical protein